MSNYSNFTMELADWSFQCCKYQSFGSGSRLTGFKFEKQPDPSIKSHQIRMCIRIRPRLFWKTANPGPDPGLFKIRFRNLLIIMLRKCFLIHSRKGHIIWFLLHKIKISVSHILYFFNFTIQLTIIIHTFMYPTPLFMLPIYP